jgi:hypothetical protein
MSQFASAGGHYIHDHTRIAWATLLAVLAVGLTFLILALAGTFSSDSAESATTLPTSSVTGDSPTTRYDGGAEEGTSGLSAPDISRYDGGPEEGTVFGGAR